MVHAYSGMEKAVERNITERINRAGMQAKFGRILVPSEEVVDVKNGQKRTTERRLFPGYVLVEMVMDDDTWHLVKHTNKVTGFVGGAKNRPAPISAERGRGHRQPDAAGHRQAAPQGGVHRWASWCA
ncbi:MAG: transcription termination/antitermination NusG family protein [Luteolibacter sp.]